MSPAPCERETSLLSCMRHWGVSWRPGLLCMRAIGGGRGVLGRKRGWYVKGVQTVLKRAGGELRAGREGERGRADVAPRPRTTVLLLLAMAVTE